MDIVTVRHSTAERRAVQYYIDDWAKAYPVDERAAMAQYMYYREMNDRPAALSAFKRLKRIDPARADLKKLEAELPKGT